MTFFSSKSRITLFLLIVFFSFSWSQNKLIRLADVTKEELLANKYPADTTAASAFLYRNIMTTMKYQDQAGYMLPNNEYVFRLKIYKKQGVNAGNIHFNYYTGAKKLTENDVIDISDCYTYNLENGKIIKTKIKKENIFFTKVNKYYTRASIAAPNLKVGSIIDIHANILYNRFARLPLVYIQTDFPVQKFLYISHIPEYFIYKTTLIGNVAISSDTKFNYGHQNFKTVTNESLGMSYNQFENTFKAENIPAFKTEPYVDNPENYKATLVNDLEIVRMPDKDPKNYAITWEDVAKQMIDDKNFGKLLTERDYLNQDMKNVIGNITDPKERMTAIFNFIQNRFTFDGNVDVFNDEKLSESYKEKIGSYSEIQMNLINMLQHGGLNAFPIMVNTNDELLNVFPSITGFSTLLAGVEIDGKRYILDAADKTAGVNTFNFNNFNPNARLIRTDGTSEAISLLPEKKDNITIFAQLAIDKDAKLSGKVRIQSNHLAAYNVRKRRKDLSEDNYLEMLEEVYNKISISNYKIENPSKNDGPAIETFDINSDREIDKFNGQLHIRPSVFFSWYKNLFNQESREHPIYFGSPTKSNINISIDIPEGYAIDFVPESINMVMGDNVYRFIMMTQQNQNNIQINVQTEEGIHLLAPEYYPDLKMFFGKLTEKLSEKIIFKKI